MFMFCYNYSNCSSGSDAIVIGLSIILIVGIIGLIWNAIEFYRFFIKKPIDKDE